MRILVRVCVWPLLLHRLHRLHECWLRRCHHCARWSRCRRRLRHSINLCSLPLFLLLLFIGILAFTGSMQRPRAMIRTRAKLPAQIGHSPLSTQFLLLFFFSIRFRDDGQNRVSIVGFGERISRAKSVVNQPNFALSYISQQAESPHESWIVLCQNDVSSRSVRRLRQSTQHKEQ